MKRQRRVEFDEMIFELAAERAFSGFAGFRHRERFGFVLKLAQIVGKLGSG
ncbi:hypothetical protein [Bradyrhizobium sp. RDI18]|uniref:hypothetical protein n=1 Tax=Bradyrhizobium sp. RDI18 TaxID=3367400 RepID=UPI00371EB54C